MLTSSIASGREVPARNWPESWRVADGICVSSRLWCRRTLDLSQAGKKTVDHESQENTHRDHAQQGGNNQGS